MRVIEKLEEMRDFYANAPCSLDRLSLKLNVSKATLSRFINGKSVSLEVFEKLAVFHDHYEENLEKLLLELLNNKGAR
jgi:transcriptional regulator with XRE-family HTH domain